MDDLIPDNYSFFTPDWAGTALDAPHDAGLNDFGVIIGSAQRVKDDNGQSIANPVREPVILIPVDLAVDANRDGIIKFAGNYNSTDPDIKSKPQDATSEDRPFRFWINNDHDNGWGYPDSQETEIPNIRDLEDYARLHIHIDAFREQFEDGTYQIGLEWRNTGGTSPSIKVTVSGESDGGTEYLTDVTSANAQPKHLDTVYVGSSAKLSFGKTVWTQGSAQQGTSSSFPNCYLLFEGRGEGKGELVLTIWKGNEKIGEGGSVWLDLKDVKKMYKRGKAQPEGIAAPFDSSEGPFAGPTNSVSDEWNWPFEKDPKEEKKAIIFVHGWSMTYDAYLDFTETMYKCSVESIQGARAPYRWRV